MVASTTSVKESPASGVEAQSPATWAGECTKPCRLIFWQVRVPRHCGVRRTNAADNLSCYFNIAYFDIPGLRRREALFLGSSVWIFLLPHCYLCDHVFGLMTAARTVICNEIAVLHRRDEMAAWIEALTVSSSACFDAADGVHQGSCGKAEPRSPGHACPVTQDRRTNSDRRQCDGHDRADRTEQCAVWESRLRAISISFAKSFACTTSS